MTLIRLEDKVEGKRQNKPKVDKPKIYKYRRKKDRKMVIGDYTVDQVIEKAQTLIEAMPYIKKFQGKTVVVKYGGSAMLDENLKYNVIKDVAMLKLVGMKPVIVHGGGKEISKWVEKVGKEAEFINGLRVTDAETMEIAEMVLGKVNKSLVSLMQKIGLKAVGISGKDGGMFTVKKKFPGGKDIGYVGEITMLTHPSLHHLSRMISSRLSHL